MTGYWRAWWYQKSTNLRIRKATGFWWCRVHTSSSKSNVLLLSEVRLSAAWVNPLEMSIPSSSKHLAQCTIDIAVCMGYSFALTFYLYLGHCLSLVWKDLIISWIQLWRGQLTLCKEDNLLDGFNTFNQHAMSIQRIMMLMSFTRLDWHCMYCLIYDKPGCQLDVSTKMTNTFGVLPVPYLDRPDYIMNVTMEWQLTLCR